MARAPNPYVRLLRENPDLRRVYFAQLISFGGDWFLTVPLFGMVFELTRSPLANAGVLVAQTLPVFLFTPLAGLAADRLDRKVILVASDLLRAVLVLGLLFVDDLRSPALAYTLVALIAVGTGFFFPASQSALPNLVKAQDLSRANVLLGSAWGTMAAVGAALGGLFSAGFGRDASFGVDALSFLASGLLVMRIRGRLSEGRSARDSAPGAPRPAGFLASAREALAYARAHREVAALLTAKGCFGLTAGGFVLLPMLALDVFRAGDRGTGLLMAARGVGAVTGPFLVRRFSGGDDRKLLGAIGYGMATWGVFYAVVSISPSLAVAALAVMLGHLGGGAQWVLSSYGLQKLTPDALRGRIASFDFGLVTLTVSGSFMLAGALAGPLGTRPVIAGSAAVAIVSGVVWARTTRKYWDKLEPNPPSTSEPALRISQPPGEAV